LKTILPLVLLGALLAGGCATWHQRTLEFHAAVHAGDLDAADRALAKSKSQARKKNRVLYYMNKGYVEFARGNTDESNKALEKAEMMAEDQRRHALDEAAALVTNPGARPYRPEDFELIRINFYKAMNYLRSGDTEGALVEARKINIKLGLLDDKYPDHANRYQRDAFAHLLMGLVYDAAGDDNNAFIAYREAREVYRADYAAAFGIDAPAQLTKDLLRSARRNGFTNETLALERESGRDDASAPASGGAELVFFWLDGLAPVKEQFVFHFATRRDGASILFYNDALGLAFPFAGAAVDANLTTLSVAFPRLVERPSPRAGARLETGGRNYPLEPVQDINAIAFKTLHDRMTREFANSLLRLAVKKGIEHAARKQNEWLGLAVSLVNSATENADTRGWQTLPRTISYARVPLAPGDNEITLRLVARDGSSTTIPLHFNGDGRGTRFHFFQTPR
jgi:tetratricopeptide (TPR) repeat protein